MKEYIYELFEHGNALEIEVIFKNIGMSIVLGFVIYVSYALSHTGTIYSKKFNTSLVVLTILTTNVMTVIGNNIALSLGMVGALSIVRFRTAIKDSRDTVYIFWTIIVGICCGVGDYTVAAIGSIAVFSVLLILGRIKNDNRILIIIKGDRNTERKIEGLIFDYFNHKAQLRVKNTSRDSIELIYEISKSIYDKSFIKQKSITELLYEIENIEYANIVVQNDEIAG